MERIDRAKVLAICEILGLDPVETHSIVVNRDTIEITRIVAVTGDDG